MKKLKLVVDIALLVFMVCLLAIQYIDLVEDVILPFIRSCSS